MIYNREVHTTFLNAEVVVQFHGSQCGILGALGWHSASLSLAGYDSACK